MKGHLLRCIILILILIPAGLLAQSPGAEKKGMEGLWTGSLYDDSMKVSIPFQLAVSEDNGKYSGYYYILFDIEGYKEMALKRVKIKQKDGQLMIEDMEVISNTYRKPRPRGVRFHTDLNLSANDTARLLRGRWMTNPTREVGSRAGTIQLSQAIEYTPEPIYQELVRLKLDQNLSFVKADRRSDPDLAIIVKKPAPINPPAPVEEVVISAPREKISGVLETRPTVAPQKREVPKKAITYASPVVITPVLAPIAERITNPELALIKNRPAAELFKNPGGSRKIFVAALTAKSRDAMISGRDKRKEDYQLAYNKAQELASAPVAVVKEPVKKPVIAPPGEKPVVKTPVATAPPVAVNKPAPAVIKEPVKPAVTTPAPTKEGFTVSGVKASTNAAADVAERTVKNEESVYFESDSLVLTLYDNGEVDGDTVSVLMNGQIVFAKQGLSTVANSKTIYFDKNMTDSISMIMYAENLGSIPPNTGLLIIMDGQKRYEVRFSADLKTNSGILLRRRKKTG